MKRQHEQLANNGSIHTSRRHLFVIFLIVAFLLTVTAILLFFNSNSTYPIITTNYSTTIADNQSISYAYYCSEVLDSNGNPHISYFASLGGSCLKYAWWNETYWIVQTVDVTNLSSGTNVTSHSVGLYSSLALDSKGYPHISYYNSTTVGSYRSGNAIYFGELKYAWWDGNLWNTQIVDTGQVGEYCSIALDNDDQPHISYYAKNYHDNKYDGDLKYAHWTGAKWDIQTIDSVDDVGYCTSIVLDSTNRPHISYLDGTNGNLKYVTWANGNWDIKVVDRYTTHPFNEGIPVGSATSLVLDSNENPRIGYIDEAQNLKYALWDGSIWDIKKVMTGNSTCNRNCWLALDSNDYPHFVYVGKNSLYQQVNSYTFWNGTSWNTVIFERHYDSTAGGCVVLDSTDNPHIIATDSLLKYYLFE